MSSAASAAVDIGDGAGAANAPARHRSGPPGRNIERWVGVGFIAPLVIYLLVFFLYPLIRNVDLSIHDYNVMAFVTGHADYVGFKNHLAVLQNPEFGQVLLNTLLFTVGSIIFQYIIGLALSVFFKNKFPLSSLLRGLFLIPWLLPLIVSGSIWSWMMDSTYGVIDSFIGIFGIGPVDWLTSPHTALLGVTIANIWLGIPFNLVILYSGLENISEDVYEAASIDGATGWQKFLRITFPLLKPVTAITLLLGFIYTLKVVDIIWIMTKGGPGTSSLTMSVMSYQSAFGTGIPDFSTASAIGNMLILIAVIFGFIYLGIQRSMEKS